MSATTDTAKLLKLQGEDEEDMMIMASCLQGATVMFGNLHHWSRRRRFIGLFNRVPREQGETADEESEGEGEADAKRVGCILCFDGVLAVRRRKQTPPDKQSPLTLLTFYFHETEAPGGLVRFVFAEQEEICLEVEALQVWLRDVDTPWEGLAPMPFAPSAGEARF